ncbi:MAG TPA: RNA-binding protein [Caulobacteraceae bacterium]
MPSTHAQASRERRDIVSGEVMDEARLIRFVAGPDGVVTPDLARKLPGRGLWVAADRASVETAVKKNAFSRAAKTKLSAPADLADQVERLLTRRILDGLGLARRAGDLTSGFEKVHAALRGGKVGWLIEAADGAEDGRAKLTNLARHLIPRPGLIGVFTAAELGLALGGENVIHSAFLAGRGAERWGQDVLRLAGFRPLLPESWREEPQGGSL